MHPIVSGITISLEKFIAIIMPGKDHKIGRFSLGNTICVELCYVNLHNSLTVCCQVHIQTLDDI